MTDLERAEAELQSLMADVPDGELAMMAHNIHERTMDVCTLAEQETAARVGFLYELTRRQQRSEDA